MLILCFVFIGTKEKLPPGKEESYEGVAVGAQGSLHYCDGRLYEGKTRDDTEQNRTRQNIHVARIKFKGIV